MQLVGIRHVARDGERGSLARLLAETPASVAEVQVLALNYGVCPGDEADAALRTASLRGATERAAGEPAAAPCAARNAHRLVIETMRCHHPEAEETEHMKYAARPTLVRFAFIHQVNWMEPGSTRRVLAPWCSSAATTTTATLPCARINHYTCGSGHAAEGLYYPGCNLLHRDAVLQWSVPAVRKALGWAPDACAATMLPGF